MISTHKKPIEQFSRVFLFLLILSLAQISFISSAEFDNVKGDLIIDETTSKYGKIIIKDWFGLLKIQEIELKTNTELCNGISCEATQEIIMYQKGVLIDDIKFIDLDSSSQTSIMNFKFYIDNQPYKLGTEVSKGTYQVRLEGNLRGLTQKVDWQIKSNGFWIEEWAVWNSSLDTNLVAYYNFDETSGNNLEDNANEHDGTLMNFTSGQWNPGLIGNALNFTGAGQWVNIPEHDDFNFSTAFTYSFWHIAQSGVSGFMIAKTDEGPFNSEYRFERSGQGLNVVVYATGLNSFNPIANLSYGDWEHLVLTFDGSNFRTYSNGGLVNTRGTGGSELLLNNVNITIGSQFTAGSPAGFFEGMIDEVGIWNVTLNQDQVIQLYNNGLGIAPEIPLIKVSLQSPEDGLVLNSSGLTTIGFNASFSVSSAGGNITNATLFVWNSSNDLFDTNISLTVFGTSNSTNLTISGLLVGENYLWNYEACAINSTGFVCNQATNNRSFILTLPIASQTFNATVYETSQETFNINITGLDGTQSVTADFIYDGVNKGAGTKVGNNSEMVFSKGITIPTNSPGTRNFSWNVTLGDRILNTTIKSVNSVEINLTLCGSAPQNIPYINLTFVNETINKESINATISTSWVYRLGTDSSSNRTFTFSNASENIEYNFCFFPGNKTLFTDVEIAYNNQESQQRIITLTSLLSSIVTKKKLYLLPTGLGLFSQFNTVNSLGSTIATVKAVITRDIGGTTITSIIDFTDSSGLVVLFLNPDITYTALFTKTGFTDNQFTFVPITNLRTVTMGSGIAAANGSTISVNTSVVITPINSTLNNNTDITFGLDVNSTGTITFISMNLTNSSGNQIGFNSNAGAGFISVVLNTGNNTQISGRYIVQTDDETLVYTKLWNIDVEFIGDYSIFKQFSFYMAYGFKDFFRFLIVFSIIIAILIFMSAGEITDTSESKIIVAVLLLWSFSFVGWLDNPSISSTTGISQFGKQYGIAILSTAAASFFILRRTFIRRI